MKWTLFFLLSDANFWDLKKTMPGDAQFLPIMLTQLSPNETAQTFILYPLFLLKAASLASWASNGKQNPAVTKIRGGLWGGMNKVLKQGITPWVLQKSKNAQGNPGITFPGPERYQQVPEWIWKFADSDVNLIFEQLRKSNFNLDEQRKIKPICLLSIWK